MNERPFDADYGSDPAECYERFFVPAIGEPVATDLIGRAALRPGERVLDVACGTGIVARLAATRVGDTGAVTALDVNPGMLAVARSVAPPGASIEWHEAPAESMPLPDAAFDVVICQLGLQFMADPVAALREMRRVLVDDGRLLLSVPGPASPLFATLADAMERHVGAEAAGFVRHVFSLHDTTEIQGLVDSAGFRDVTVEAGPKLLQLPPSRDFLWQYVQSTPLGPVMAGQDEETRGALEREILEHWREFEVEDGLAYEQRLVVATGRK